MSDHPKCPSCGTELEGWSDPDSADWAVVYALEAVRLGNDLARTVEMILDLRGTGPTEGVVELLTAALTAWRAEHPQPRRMSHPQPGGNLVDKSPNPDQKEKL
jgi:hypothetical protein